MLPSCYCFGFTEAMVAAEIRDTGKGTIPQRIRAEVKAGNCACEIRNPQASCCLGNVNPAIKRVMALRSDPITSPGQSADDCGDDKPGSSPQLDAAG